MGDDCIVQCTVLYHRVKWFSFFLWSFHQLRCWMLMVRRRDSNTEVHSTHLKYITFPGDHSGAKIYQQQGFLFLKWYRNHYDYFCTTYIVLDCKNHTNLYVLVHFIGYYNVMGNYWCTKNNSISSDLYYCYSWKTHTYAVYKSIIIYIDCHQGMWKCGIW